MKQDYNMMHGQKNIKLFEQLRFAEISNSDTKFEALNASEN
jgi:hypothetical protein